MEVKLGMSPISWTNDDLPELGGDTSLETCLKKHDWLDFQVLS